MHECLAKKANKDLSQKGVVKSVYHNLVSYVQAKQLKVLPLSKRKALYRELEEHHKGNGDFGSDMNELLYGKPKPRKNEKTKYHRY